MSQHRTTSVDYLIFQTGSVVYLTPGEAFDPVSGTRKLEETVCRAGDILVQGATLHG